MTAPAAAAAAPFLGRVVCPPLFELELEFELGFPEDEDPACCC